MNQEDDAPEARSASQHEPHVANSGWPNWGRDALDHGHAVFAMAAHLKSLNLTGWITTVVNWLGHFDGFEAYVEEGDDPIIAVRNLLASYVARLRPGRLLGDLALAAHELKQHIVDDLLGMEFLRYRAYWGRGLVHEPDARVWNSLAQPWLEFVESGEPEEQLMVWRSGDRPYPALDEHRLALLRE